MRVEERERHGDREKGRRRESEMVRKEGEERKGRIERGTVAHPIMHKWMSIETQHAARNTH